MLWTRVSAGSPRSRAMGSEAQDSQGGGQLLAQPASGPGQGGSLRQGAGDGARRRGVDAGGAGSTSPGYGSGRSATGFGQSSGAAGRPSLAANRRAGGGVTPARARGHRLPAPMPGSGSRRGKAAKPARRRRPAGPGWPGRRPWRQAGRRPGGEFAVEPEGCRRRRRPDCAARQRVLPGRRRGGPGVRRSGAAGRRRGVAP